MRSLRLAVLLFATLECAAQNTSHDSFSGEIADSSCALNVHSLTRSHKEMLKNKSMGGSSASCTRLCVEHYGAEYVMVNHKNVYHLEGQPGTVWQDLAGKQVTIHGSLDSAGVIHVTSVEP